MIGVLFYKLGAFFARRLPQRLSESIAEAFVALQYLARFRSRRIIRHNLRIVLGKDAAEQEIRDLTRRVFSNFGKSIYYFLRLPFISQEELRVRCDTSGIEEITAQVAKNGGCIFVGPHLGAWEVGGACLNALGIDLFTVALPHPSAEVTRFFNERRELLGVECASLGDSARTLRRALRGGKSVALLVDRPYNSRTDRFTWFGREMDLPIGHVALAVRCRTPVVTTACVFDGEGRFKFVFGGPHYPREDLAYDQAMRDLQHACLLDMTTFIESYPDQWFHFQPFGGHRIGDHSR